MGKDRFLNMAFPPGSPVVPKQSVFPRVVGYRVHRSLARAGVLPAPELAPSCACVSATDLCSYVAWSLWALYQGALMPVREGSCVDGDHGHPRAHTV